MARLEYRTISHRTVHALPVGEKDAVYWDRKLQGFGVRVYPSGSKVYVVQTRAGGKSKRVAIGRHGVITSDAGPQPRRPRSSPASRPVKTPTRKPRSQRPHPPWSSSPSGTLTEHMSRSGANRGRSRPAAGW